jgi:hypothetical protein
MTREPGGKSPLGKHWTENIDTEVKSNGIWQCGDSYRTVKRLRASQDEQ